MSNWVDRMLSWVTTLLLAMSMPVILNFVSTELKYLAVRSQFSTTSALP